jgi:hypothetical protein
MEEVESQQTRTTLKKLWVKIWTVADEGGPGRIYNSICVIKNLRRARVLPKKYFI